MTRGGAAQVAAAHYPNQSVNEILCGIMDIWLQSAD